MEINERIKSIMEHYSINATELANKLKVQRSGISHILSGRNKPGLDFLEKLLLHFTEISAEWLVTGQEEMVKAIELQSPPHPKANALETKQRNNDTSILKVIILYHDGSFSEFNPH